MAARGHLPGIPNVEVTSPTRQILSQDLAIHSWGNLRLSTIRSSGIGLEWLPSEPHAASQDAYFVVVLLSGDYVLEQNGNEAVLRPGDLTIYDATRPHRIHCPRDFSKLILSIPRPALRARMAGIEACTGSRISGAAGIGAVVSSFLQSCGENAGALTADESFKLADQAVDLATLAANAVRPSAHSLSQSRSASIWRVKALIEARFADFDLDTAMVARQAGLSPRYLNSLFREEGTSLMRYVWKRRLERCAKDLSNQPRERVRQSDVAFRWGFNDASHFSRAFKQTYGYTPSAFRQRRLVP